MTIRLVALLCISFQCAFSETAGPFVRLGSDAATESTVLWLSTEAEPFSIKIKDEWKPQEPEQEPFGPSQYTVNRVKLSGLAPAGTYEFKLGEKAYKSNHSLHATASPMRH